jgi:riboflavin kinase/FMN adenylyltransferase
MPPRHDEASPHGPAVATARSAAGVIVVRGTVEHGDQRGRQLGFPTANLSLADATLVDGVWAGWMERGDGPLLPAAVSVGRRPTVYREGIRLLEAHLIDFDGDLYGERVTVWLVRHLRSQRRFDGLDALVRQLHRDVARAARWCRATDWTPPSEVRHLIDADSRLPA